MTIDLNSTGAIFGILGGAVVVAAALFSALRYIIRAETVELRHNGGGSIKDTVHKTAGKAAAIEKKLDEHVRDSKALIEQGGKDKAAILERQDKQDQIIATLAEAVSVAARSTPPPEEQHQ